MKKKYISPEFKVVAFECENIITTSSIVAQTNKTLLSDELLIYNFD